MGSNHLFDKLPPNIFRPLTSSYRLLYWRILEALQESLFELDDAVTELGHAKPEVLEIIEKAIASNINLLTTEIGGEGDEVGQERKPHYYYYDLLKFGWLHEEKRGFHVYVSMPQPANALLSALLDIADARPLMTQGELLGFRDRISSIVDDPYNNANNMRALAKSARQFSRHLSSIKGAIKLLHDRITPDVAYSETVNIYFDDFIGEIFARDYVAIKTSDHPLKIRDHILERVSLLRFNQEKHNAIVAGYRQLEPETGLQALEKDLSLLERVFDRVENQLRAIDLMGARYNKRVDAVIAYAKRTPKSNARLIQRIVKTLSRLSESNEGLTVAMPLCATSPIGEARFRKPIKPRESAQPKPVKTAKEPTPAMLRLRARQLRESDIRKMASVSDKSLSLFLEQTMAQNVVVELSSIPVNTIEDIFHVLSLHRIARTYALKGSDCKQSYPTLLSRYTLTPTNNFVETEFFETTDVVIDRQR